MFSKLACLMPKETGFKSLNSWSVKVLKVLVFVVWLSVVVATYSFAVIYSATPGKAKASPLTWPQGSKLKLDCKRMTLVMLIHPKCTCSRASLNELRKILCHCPQKFKTYILMVVPEGLDASWAKTDLFDTARSIKDAQVIFDHEGAIADSFGALTSGHTLVYSASGKLAFTGGITASRAHEGDNYGQGAIEKLARDGVQKSASVQVFGCPLKGD